MIESFIFGYADSMFYVKLFIQPFKRSP